MFKTGLNICERQMLMTQWVYSEADAVRSLQHRQATTLTTSTTIARTVTTTKATRKEQEHLLLQQRSWLLKLI